MSNPKRHHFVPRVYLDRFALDGLVHVRRRDGGAFNANPVNVAVECGFYGYAVRAVTIGDLGVVLNGLSGELELAALRGDGMWASIPAPDVVDLHNWQLGEVDGTLLVTGLDCEGRNEDDCDSGGRPAAYRYLPDGEEWASIEFPGVDPPTSGARLLPSANGARAVIVIRDDVFSVTGAGAIAPLPPAPTHTFGTCVAGSHLVALGEEVSYGQWQANPSVAVLDLTADEPEWVTAPDREPSSGSGGASEIWFAACGFDGPIFLGDGVDVVFDAADGAWNEQEVVLPVHLDPAQTHLPRVDFEGVAYHDDGTLVTATGSGAVVRRTPAGAWEDAGVYAGSILVVGGVTFVWGRDAPGPQRLDT